MILKLCRGILMKRCRNLGPGGSFTPPKKVLFLFFHVNLSNHNERKRQAIPIYS
jgi:hypothetical protein